MYVCICNGFTDKKLKDACASHPAARLRDIYMLCSNGQKPQCGKCIATVKDITKCSRGRASQP